MNRPSRQHERKITDTEPLTRASDTTVNRLPGSPFSPMRWKTLTGCKQLTIHFRITFEVLLPTPMRNLFFILICILSTPLYAQIPKFVAGPDPRDPIQRLQLSEGAIHPGVYQFGLSEGQLDLLVIPHGKNYIVQYIYGGWERSYYTREMVWIHKYATFNDVKPDSNRLHFGKYTAHFVNYQSNRKSVLINGNLLQNRVLSKDSVQIGFYSSNVERYYQAPELYELSLELKSFTFFKRKSTQNLETMRYTLFAKYGQVFRLGDETDEYFRKKEWYEPCLLETADLLTDIEKANLKMLEAEINRR